MAVTDRTSGLLTSAAIKVPVACATTGAITLSGLQTIDGVSVTEGMRVLVKNQGLGVENGIYVATTGDWVRSGDFNGNNDITQGTLVFVVGGSTNGATTFKLTTASPLIGITSLAFTIQTEPSSVVAGSVTFVDSRNFDLAGDGVTDDSAGFAAFVAECKAQELPGFLAPGKYKISNVTIDGAVHIVGTSGMEGYDTDKGSWIIHEDESNPALIFTGTDARGARLDSVSFYQAHPSVGSGWAPTTYPYVITVLDCFGGVQLHNLFMHGVYRGISAVNSGRTEIHGLFGQFFQNAIYLDQQYDACSIANVHHWPYYSTDLSVYAWMHTNHVTFLLGRVDSAVFSGKIFSYGGRYGFQFASTASGKATRIKVHSAQFDGIPTGIYVSSGADEVTAEFGILDCQGQDLEAWDAGAGTLAAVTGLPAIFLDAADARINIGSLRTELHGQGLVTMSNASKGNRLNIGFCRGTSYNLDGGAVAFRLGNTDPATNGGYPVNQCAIGTSLFLEGGNGAANEDASATGVLTTPSAGGASVDSLDVGGTYVVRADAPSGIEGQGLFRSTTNGSNQVLQLVAEGTDTNVDIQLIPKGTGRILDASGSELGGSGAGGAKLVSPDATQEAEIKNTAGFFVTDITQSKAAALSADGNVTGAAVAGKSIWEQSDGSTTYDLKNYIDKEIAANVASAGDTLTSADTTVTAVINDDGGLYVTDTGTSKAARVVADGNIDGGAGGQWVESSGTPTTDLKNYLDKKFAAAGGGGGASIVSGANEATIGSGGVSVTNGSRTAVFQNDGNISGAEAFTNASNGGLGGTGTVTSYIEARIAAYWSANIGSASVNYATSAGSASSATTATNATYLGGGTGIANVGGALGVSSARYQTDGNVQGSAWNTWSGYLYNAVVTSSDQAVKRNVKPLNLGLNMVAAIEPKSYQFRAPAKLGDHEQVHFGFIAQDIEQYAPNLIGKHAMGGHKTLDYLGLIAVLWSAVQELNQKIDDMKKDAA